MKNVLVFALVISLVAGIFSGCSSSLFDSRNVGGDSGSNNPVDAHDSSDYNSNRQIDSFRNVPGITEQDIADVEELIARRDSFIFGNLLGTELYLNRYGEMEGFTAFLCDWFTQIFGIEFEPRIYEWVDLLDGLESGDIDFTGELAVTSERQADNYIMTDGVAKRLVVYFCVEGRPPIDEIKEERAPNYGFLSHTTTLDYVRARHEGPFGTFIFDNIADIYGALEGGVIDAFIGESTAEEAFNMHSDIVIEDFLPPVYGSISISTKKPDNEPIIRVIQKIIDSDDF